MKESFQNAINAAKSALILIEKDPNTDTVSSALSLYLYLVNKKETSISCPTPMRVEFNRLVGVDKVTQEIGNKNLVISFPVYKAQDFEKVNCDVENNQVFLTVIPAMGKKAPRKHEVKMNYSGISADLIILVGGNTKDKFPALSMKEIETVKKLHISKTELENSQNLNLLSFAQARASVSEIVADLLPEIDTDTATNLMTGLEEGTKNFTEPLVDSNTFSLAAKLLASGAKRHIKSQNYQPEQKENKSQPLFPFKKPAPKDTPPKSWLEPKIYKGTSA